MRMGSQFYKFWHFTTSEDVQVVKTNFLFLEQYLPSIWIHKSTSSAPAAQENNHPNILGTNFSFTLYHDLALWKFKNSNQDLWQILFAKISLSMLCYMLASRITENKKEKPENLN